MSPFTQEMIEHFEKEKFIREEKGAFASGDQALFFTNVHVGALIFFIPSFGFGARYQRGSTGFDASLDYHTILVANGLSTKASLLYFFPHADFDKQFYAGIGGGGVVYLGSGGHSDVRGRGFGVLTFGKKMGRKTYTQCELLGTRIDRTTIFLPTIKVGMGF